MTNMSYCRWENTAGDLRDCVESMHSNEHDVESFNDHERNGYASCIDFAITLIATVETDHIQRDHREITEAVRNLTKYWSTTDKEEFALELIRSTC